MKFGKVLDITGVDFSLPADENAPFLASLPEQSAPFGFYFGCTGWSMKEWVGKVYPKGTKSKDYLRVYSRQFNTIELNTTHYRSPSAELVEKWTTESPTSFRFCPKVLQPISHSKELGKDKPIFQVFTEAIGLLGEQLGACFIQLPPYFGFDRLPLLEDFLERWPNYLPLAVELRHESWFNDPMHLNRLCSVLEQHQAGFVITDVAGRRDVLHMRLTAPFTMIRFVGNGLVPSDYSRIDEWIDRLEAWHRGGLQTCYFFPHEPDNLLAPDLSLYLADQIAQRFGLELPRPNLDGSFVDPEQDQQMSLF
ncbi:MAG: DUF72 domain-containing protein [Bacteroidota bacterium]